tara:strand:+ start:394 stop:597 length:204 start_codon:yes stop_codon:yes gene_type:complete
MSKGLQRRINHVEETVASLIDVNGQLEDYIAELNSKLVEAEEIIDAYEKVLIKFRSDITYELKRAVK